MNYYFYNTDARSLRGERRPHLLIELGLAVTGGPTAFGEQLRQLEPGDRVLMYENGVGIAAVGDVLESWDGQAHRVPVYYVLGKSLIDPEREYRIRVNWFLDLTGSPVSVQDVKKRLGYQPRGAVKQIVKWRAEVEKIIAEHLPWRSAVISEEVVDASGTIPEGAKQTVTVNAYERNPVARARCIEHWGLECAVCRAVLRDVYGERASGYIHVHHLIPLHRVGSGYAVDPVADMRPVCPNCHAVLHRTDPPCSIEELAAEIHKAAKAVVGTSLRAAPHR